MQSYTVADRILMRMRASKGSVWAAKDFLDFAGRPSVDQALRRLSLAGSIRKIARGLYDYPILSPLVGTRAPVGSAVAKAAARARGAQVRPTGAAAANALGLTTQVPARADYITDGPSRRIAIGKQTIYLKRVSPSRLALSGGAGALVEALRYLGMDAVALLDDADVQGVSRALSATDIRRLRKAMLHAPEWMRSTINAVIAAHPSARASGMA